MKKKEKLKDKIDIIKGQLSIFDMEITKKSKSFTKTEEKVTENKVLFTKITSKKIGKATDSLEPTEKQQQFLSENKFKENENLSRIIKYCGGGLGIELEEVNSYKTIYVNADGKEEFSVSKKCPVLPMDKIIYCKNLDIQINDIQEEKLKNLLEKVQFKRVIHRKGDENILVEVAGKIIDILPNGWVLEFESLDHIECSEDEVYLNIKENIEDLKEMQQQVKVGDYVQAKNSKKMIEGLIVRVYGVSNQTLNISFDNRTKQTAIPRVAVTKILNNIELCG